MEDAAATALVGRVEVQSDHVDERLVNIQPGLAS